MFAVLHNARDVFMQFLPILAWNKIQSVFNSKDNLNVNLRIGIRHSTGRSYGACFLFCIDFYKQVAPMGAVLLS